MWLNKYTIGGMVSAAILIVIGIISGDQGVFANLLIISIFVGVVPFFVYNYIAFAWIKAVEDHFPNFVRDMADSVRSGMSFTEAVNITSKANYGKLSEEVIKMHNRLTWGTPFIRVLEIFGEEVKKSKLITESLNIIKEAYLSGGNVDATLDAIANDMVMFKEIEAERRSMVRQHVLIMYGIFFMFVGISVMIIYVMIPMIETPLGSSGGIESPFSLSFNNPCEGVNFFPCDYYGLLGYVFGIPESIALYYTAMFFTAALLQGIFTGLIAGQLGENSVTAGSKHAVIMAVAAIAIFITLAKLGVFPIGGAPVTPLL